MIILLVTVGAAIIQRKFSLLDIIANSAFVTVGAVFTVVVVPETKGKSVEEIAQIFK